MLIFFYAFSVLASVVAYYFSGALPNQLTSISENIDSFEIVRQPLLNNIYQKYKINFKN